MISNKIPLLLNKKMLNNDKFFNCFKGSDRMRTSPPCPQSPTPPFTHLRGEGRRSFTHVDPVPWWCVTFFDKARED